MPDTALMDDAPAPTATLDPNAPTTPTDRLVGIATILAEGIRRRRRQLAISGPNIVHQEGSPARLELSEHARPDGSRG
ncbi:MAG: hypothetical protein IT432_16415 [Phycisphaerales bacterium]|nr:hypothetical protein [Phycisphaerales bacterium]